MFLSPTEQRPIILETKINIDTAASSCMIIPEVTMAIPSSMSNN
jgi:hypothetical protein